MFSRIGMSLYKMTRLVQSMKRIHHPLSFVSPFRPFATSILYNRDRSTYKGDKYHDVDVFPSTEDPQIIQLSQYVMNNDVEKSLKEYSKIPLFLPRSDFRIVCSLMQQLGERCGIPDLDNIFTKIQKMKLSRKHALTFRCLIRLACELKNPELIQSFYTSICDEEVYVNNSFLNDITIDCLFSLEAYQTICSIFDTVQLLIDRGSLLPTFNNHSSQNAITAFISEGRDDLLLFFLQRIKTNWRIPVVITDYIVSNSVCNHDLSLLFDKCILSQPKSATLFNSIIDFYVQDGNAEMAISTIQKAMMQEVKVTSMSYKNVCELLLVLKGHRDVQKELVTQLCHSICTLSRGGYIVMLGLSPLEMMLVYHENGYAQKYIQLLKEFDNGLVKKDIKLLEELKAKFGSSTEICNGLDEIVLVIQHKYA